MEQHTLININNCFNTNNYSLLETSGGQSSNRYLNCAHFLTPALIRHLWQLKTVVFLHWCLICSAFFCQIHVKLKIFFFSVILLLDFWKIFVIISNSFGFHKFWPHWMKAMVKSKKIEFCSYLQINWMITAQMW